MSTQHYSDHAGHQNKVAKAILNGMFRKGFVEYREEHPNTFCVNPDVAYPAILKKLDLPIDHYSLAVCRRCCANMIKDRMRVPVHVRILKGSGKWARILHPIGRGAEAGADEFRKHYNKIKHWLLERG